MYYIYSRVFFYLPNSYHDGLRLSVSPNLSGLSLHFPISFDSAYFRLHVMDVNKSAQVILTGYDKPQIDETPKSLIEYSKKSTWK